MFNDEIKIVVHIYPDIRYVIFHSVNLKKKIQYTFIMELFLKENRVES